MELPQGNASLLGGSGQCKSCNALHSLPKGSGQRNSYDEVPHCPGAVGSGTPAMHCPTARGQWAVQIPHKELPQGNATLLGGSGQCKSCKVLHSLPKGSGQRNSYNEVPPCPGAVGSGTPAMHCPTARGQWAVQIVQCTAPSPRGGAQWDSFHALPHRLGAVWQRNLCYAMPHCLGTGVVQLVQCTALPA